MTTPKIISWQDAQTLNVMRFKAQRSHKAGILPFYFVGDELRMVVYAPVPQHEGEHGKILPYQLARGTIQAKYRLDGKEFWQDKGRRPPPKGSEWLEDEKPAITAMREAEEELGLKAADILTLYDCGWLPYQNPRGKVYNIAMFLARIPDPSVLAFPDPYASAARLDGVTLEDAKELARIPDAESSFDMRPFKPSYVTLLEALHGTVLEMSA